MPLLEYARSAEILCADGKFPAAALNQLHDGLKNTAEVCLAKASYLSEHLASIKGINAPHFDAPFFKEFVFTFEDKNIQDTYIEFMRSKKIIPGLSLSNINPEFPNGILTSVTEMTPLSDLNQFIAATREFFDMQGGN